MACRVAIVTTHPIQYNAPVFRCLAQRKDVDIKVFYSWQGAAETEDPEFLQTISWDIPLLSGYEYTFTENVATKKGSDHFGGVICPYLNNDIDSWNPDAIIIYGWCYRAHLSVMRTFKGQIPIFFRGDSTLLGERFGPRQLARRVFLRWVYSHINVALAVGANNAAYFLRHGVPTNRIVLAPHAVDNDRFADDYHASEQAAKSWKDRLGIPPADTVFLFCGKLGPIKATDRLLNAFKSLQLPDAHLIFVGTGPSEPELRKNSSDKVHFLGFQNQSVMPTVYRIGDLLVLPSHSETWGLALNEAMACGRAVLASDRVGAAVDLIRPQVNGWIFNNNNPQDLSATLAEAHACGKVKLREMGNESFKIIADWSIAKQVDAICNAVLSYVNFGTIEQYSFIS